MGANIILFLNFDVIFCVMVDLSYEYIWYNLIPRVKIYKTTNRNIFFVM
jgi:hypothetical protein